VQERWSIGSAGTRASAVQVAKADAAKDFHTGNGAALSGEGDMAPLRLESLLPD